MYQYMNSLSFKFCKAISACSIVLLITLAGMHICFAQEITEQVKAKVEAEHAARLAATLKELGYGSLSGRRTGDLDMMEKSRIIRVLTVYGLGKYYLDGVEQKGVTYELFSEFERFINDRLKRDELKIHVVFVPVARNELIKGLIEGRGDIIAAQLTITPERDKSIDFSAPVSNEISEILVTGPSAPAIKTLDDLAGREIYVRASSSYRSSLDAVNARLKKEGKKPIKLIDADERLEDADLLEMVNSGLLPWIVVDDYEADIWSEAFDNLVVRSDIVFRKGGHLGFGVRDHSPLLVAALNDFLKTHRQGTLQGNMLINRNLRDAGWTKNALDQKDFDRFKGLEDIFETYGTQYGIDYVMVAAQGYQESRLDQSARSHRGAIGVMQLMEATAKDKNVNIPDITTADNNIHAGVKYLDFIREHYFSDPEIDQFNKTMFAFAAYNAGPARVRDLRDKAGQAGYDPDVWFDNVELIAAKEIGHETVQYVANILKYYVAYSLAIKPEVDRRAAREEHSVK